MKILVLNCGSSSIKYQLIETAAHTVLAKGGIEKIGLPGSFIKFNTPGGKQVIEQAIPEHTVGVRLIFQVLTSPEYGALGSLDELDAVGHRIVHGGERFAQSVLLTPEVLAAIESCNDLAPLHNPANLKGVAAVAALLPEIPQVGVFDTAFHQTMPPEAYMYAVPYELYEQYGVRRYGFHGTSHRYVSARALEYLRLQPQGTRVITAHIGNGGSLAAVRDGKCIDTSMGLTPLEGVVMGTRSGDIDGGAVAFIQKKLGLDADGISDLLNKRSGVAGITGVSSDMREVYQGMWDGNERCRLAIDMYAYRIRKYIGAYTAALGGCDVLVFTAGVCENQAEMREQICQGLECLGIRLDHDANYATHGTEALISTPDSRVKVVVIPTDEEMMIARDTEALAGK